MLLVSLEDCPGCNMFKMQHPEIPFIELPRNEKHDNEQSKTIRAIVKRLNVFAYPVLLTDELNAIIPLNTVDSRWPEDRNK